MFNITQLNDIKVPNIRFIDVSRWMALLCAFGMPWSNAFFNVGVYCMLIFFTLSFAYKECWQSVLKTPTVIIALSLFILITIETAFSVSNFDLGKYDLIHYRKLLAIPIFVALFTTVEEKKQLFISYCLGVSVLMLPTLLDGFGLISTFPLNSIFTRNAAYASTMHGVPNLVYWRNQITHGFHVSILFSACALGAIYFQKYRTILFVVTGLCTIDLLFFIYGRMALLSLVVAIITMAIIYLPSKKHILLFLIFLATASTAIYFKSSVIQTRLNSITSEANAYIEENNISTSAGNRLHYWKNSLHLFQLSPIVGNGSGSFRQSLIDNKDPLVDAGHRHPHNEYLMQLAQYGLIGFFLLSSLIVITLINSKKIQDKWLAHSITTAVVIFSLNALTDCSLHNDWEGWSFVLFASIACINKSQTTSKLSET